MSTPVPGVTPRVLSIIVDDKPSLGDVTFRSDATFQIRLLLANRGHFSDFNPEYVLLGIGKCAEFRINGCKFIFISFLRARI